MQIHFTLELKSTFLNFQCVIDLKENCLRIGTTGTTAPFLAEKDIPKPAEDNEPSGSAQGKDLLLFLLLIVAKI